MKTQQRERGAPFAEDGLAIKQIARRLSVSQASVSVWVRAIEADAGAAAWAPVQSIYGAIQESGGFDRPGRLD